MNTIENLFVQAMQAIWNYLVPHGASTEQPFWSFALTSLGNAAKGYFWFMILGIVIFAFYLRKPGEKLSVWAALKHLFPAKIYKHRSFRVDMTFVPFAYVLRFVAFAGLAVGAGLVQIWLVEKFGPSTLQVPAGGLAVVLQIIFILLGADIARFAWRYQAHHVPFFWEFHKGHHSVEVLHPLFIRTHPVDQFVRLLYMNFGGGILGGGMMYLAGVNASAMAITYLVFFRAVIGTLQRFEHSHIPLSFGKTINNIIYPPFYHPFHHSARPEHRNKNLGRPCGLIIWDKLFGTLYVPKPGEFGNIIFGSSLEELGDANPHRTLWRFLTNPFIEAGKILGAKKGNTSPVEAPESAGTL